MTNPEVEQLSSNIIDLMDASISSLASLVVNISESEADAVSGSRALGRDLVAITRTIWRLEHPHGKAH